jgi:uncharacterized damage-inducible protein DinB
MKTSLRNILVPVLSLAVCSVVARAAAPVSSTPTPAAAAAKVSFQTDFLAQIDDIEKKILALEDAVPQNKFTWRPAPGVRSIAEAYLHIAFGNYGFTKVATGKDAPPDSGFDMKNRDKWDQRTTDKAEIKTTLEKSFDHMRSSVKLMADADLDKKVSFFGHDATARYVLLGLLGHDNEHLGQSIAYARANKITPPWSKEK